MTKTPLRRAPHAHVARMAAYVAVALLTAVQIWFIVSRSDAESRVFTLDIPHPIAIPQVSRDHVGP